MRRVQRCILLTLTAAASTVAPAQAQWEVTPYLGINLAGDAEFRRGGPGVSVAFAGERLGFEFDVERYNHFFKDKDVANLVPNNCGVGPKNESCVDLNTDAIGFMGNVIAPIRISDAKNWRPYATAGLGVIYSWVTSFEPVADTNQNNFAFNVGGGVMYYSTIAWPCEGRAVFPGLRQRGQARWLLLQRLRLLARDVRRHIRFPAVIETLQCCAAWRARDRTRVPLCRVAARVAPRISGPRQSKR